jgi:hypothetical protein
MAKEQETSTIKRRTQLRAVADAYFGALARKDFAAIPYDDNVVLRAPSFREAFTSLSWEKTRCGLSGGHRWSLL